MAKEGKGRESKYQHRVFKEEDDKWIIWEVGRTLRGREYIAG